TAYDAQGNVRAQDRSLLMSADHARGTQNPRTAFLDNIHYQMIDKRGNGTAATANMTDAEHGVLTEGTFSTCDPDDRRWYLRSDTLEMDKVKNRGYAHDVTLYYADVPFFWFPYFAFPLGNERESGFLAPHLGYGNRRGLVIGAGPPSAAACWPASSATWIRRTRRSWISTSCRTTAKSMTNARSTQPRRRSSRVRRRRSICRS